MVKGVAQDLDYTQTRRRASAPLQAIPTMFDGDDIIYPEHSISQAYQRAGGVSLADRIGGAGPSSRRDGYFVVDSEEALADMFRASASFRDPYGLGKGLPNTISTSRRAVSEMSSSHASLQRRQYENDAAESFASTSSSTHSVSLKDLLIGSNAQMLASVVMVATRFLPALQRKVAAKGMFMDVVSGIGANAIGSAAPYSTIEPPSVWVVLGLDKDAVRRLAQSHLGDSRGGRTTEPAGPCPEVQQAALAVGDARGSGRVYVSKLQLLTASAIGSLMIYFALLLELV